MTTLDHDDIATLWVQLGGPQVFADRAAAQAQAESAGVIEATNTNHNPDGTTSTDRGLFQINSVHGAESSYQLSVNIRAAIAISNQGANWRPWCTAWSDNACGHRGGSYQGAGAAYKSHMTGRYVDTGIRLKKAADGSEVLVKNGKNVVNVQAHATDPGAGGDAVPQGITGGAATGVAKGVAHAALSVGEFLALLAKRETWVRALYVLGGLVLVVLGAFLLDKSLMAQVAGTAVTNVVGAVAKHAI